MMKQQITLFLDLLLFISQELEMHCIIRRRVEMNIPCMLFIMYAVPLNIQN